jgi:exodeoxyribonuclease VII large subunit
MVRNGWDGRGRGEPGDVYTVSEIVEAIRQHLETEFPDINIIGEIANFRAHSSGHFYFSLRDGKNLIRIVVFKRYAEGISFTPEDGQLVVAEGRISHYGGSGQTQLIAHTLRLAGRGLMEVDYARLLKKLMDEGMTAPDRKRSVPRYPSRIVVITSPTGAVIRDIVDTIGRRWPIAEVIHIEVDVQGARAEESIVRAFSISNGLEDVDVVILARGGGSVEDLWTFNRESVARAVASSMHPVITGIGHEIDTTASDYVSDIRAATPTAAAELATPLRDEVRSTVEGLIERIESLGKRSSIERLRLVEYLLRSSVFPAIIHRLDRSELLFSDLVGRLGGWWEEMRLVGMTSVDSSGIHLEAAMVRVLRARESSLAVQLERISALHPRNRVCSAIETLKGCMKIIQVRSCSYVVLRRKELSERLRTLSGMHPLTVLKRGYAVCTSPADEMLITRSGDVATGESMAVHFYDGGAICRVERKRKGMPWRKRRASKKR